MASSDATPTVVRTIPVLGRTLTLGSLYNIHTGETGTNPVAGEQVSSDTSIQGTRTEICQVSDAFQKLDVYNELRLNLLLNPKQISGSAEVLLHDEDESVEQVLLIFTSVSERRSVEDSFGPDESGRFTHRITSALHGTRAVILFEAHRLAGKKSKKTPSLFDLVLKLPKIKELDSYGLYRLDYRERELCKRVKCSLFSDVPIKFDVTSVSQAVDFYHKLPQLLSGAETTPLSVEISQLEPMVNSEISADLVNGICDVMSSMGKFLKTCSALLAEELLQKFPSTEEKIALYKEVVESFQLNITQKIGDQFIQVKSGTLDEEILKQSLSAIDNSPFHMNVGYQDILQAWLNEQKGLEAILGKVLTDRNRKVTVLGIDEAEVAIAGATTEYTAVFYLGVTAEEKEHLLNMADFAEDCVASHLDEVLVNLRVYPGSAASLNEKLRDFLSLAKASQSQMTYIITEEAQDTVPKGQIRIYKKEELVQDDFIIPRKLKEPEILERHHDRIVVNLNDNNATVAHYELVVKTSYDTPLQTKSVPGSTKQITLDSLKAGTLYRVKVRCLTILGPSSYSPEVFVATGPSERPQRPIGMQVSSTGCVIQWPRPRRTTSTSYNSRSSGLSWEVEIRWNSEEKIQHVSGDTDNVHVHLEPNTTYRFRVRATFKIVYQRTTYPSKSEYSDESEPFQLSASALQIAKNRSLLSSEVVKDGCPSIHHLKMKREYTDSHHRLRRLSYGPPDANKPMKTILVVGATGAGKSTLINAFANYLLGVQFEDKYRFRIIDENIHADQSVSQTKWVTAYVMYHQATFPPELPYSLTIIDTPGFGDTQGIQADKEITDQLSEYFHAKGHEGIDTLDAIGFVIQASLPRLTPTQQYIFDSILALFGNDVKENIFVLITFADGQRAPVLTALDKANLPYTRSFKFNNSALFAEKSTGARKQNSDDDDSDEEQSFDRNFWTMGAASYKKFLIQLSKTEAKSLVLTNQVLDERQRLETHVTGIQNQILVGLAKQDNLRAGLECLRQHQTDIDRNKDFEFEVNTTKIVAIALPRGQYVTNCLTCNMTCHYPCGIPNDDGKHGCWAMNSAGQNSVCRICPNACHWSVHRNTPERLEVQNVTETQTVSQMKQEYEDACEEQLTTEELIFRILDDIEGQETYTALLVEEPWGEIRKAFNQSRKEKGGLLSAAVGWLKKTSSSFFKH